MAVFPSPMIAGPPFRRRLTACLGLLALLVNLLVPLAVAQAMAVPAGEGAFICHAGGPAAPAPVGRDAADHHCPLCLSQTDTRLLVPVVPAVTGRIVPADRVDYLVPGITGLRPGVPSAVRARGPPIPSVLG